MVATKQLFFVQLMLWGPADRVCQPSSVRLKIDFDLQFGLPFAE